MYPVIPIIRTIIRSYKDHDTEVSEQCQSELARAALNFNCQCCDHLCMKYVDPSQSVMQNSLPDFL